MADDDVVDEMDLQQLGRLAQCAGEAAISIAGRGITGRVIVRNRKGKGSIGEHLLQDLARVSHALIEPTLEQALAMDEAELGVQKKHVDLFVIECLHLAGQVIEDEIGPVHRLITNGFAGGALPDFEGGGEDGGLGRA